MRAAVAGVVAALVLSGCSSPAVVGSVHSPAPGEEPLDESSENVTCVDWATFSTFDDMVESADLVIVGTAAPSTENINLFGVDAPLHTVTISRVVAGEYSGSTIEVAAVPDTCSKASAYPSGDPLATTDVFELFLTPTSEYWRPLTPQAGIEPIPLGDPLPWEPAPTP
jgi:hypothetical protein